MAEPSRGRLLPGLPMASWGARTVCGPGGRGKSGERFLNVVQPVVNVNPWLVIDIRTDDGETMAVRGAVFLGRDPRSVCRRGTSRPCGGRLTHQGYIKPSYIINESTGSRWRRWAPVRSTSSSRVS